jgi:4-hydroxybenzoate polyprenyltransferase
MRIKFDIAALGQTKWYQYVTRFIFGGCITAAAGLVARKFGPAVGGLLLAFPAIFPATATLIEKHEKEKKEKKGLRGTVRGRQAASVDAAGSAMGSLGLLVFALLVWQFVSSHRPWLVLLGATAAWLAASVLVWKIRLRARTIRRRDCGGALFEHDTKPSGKSCTRP